MAARGGSMADDASRMMTNFTPNIGSSQVTTRCNPKEQVHILPEAKTHRNNPIAGVRSLIPGDSVVKAKMITDATIPWKYKSIKQEGVPPLFMRARFQETPLEEYLSPEDFKRWVD